MDTPEFYAPAFKVVVGGRELAHGVTIDLLSVSVTETVNQADSFNFSVRDRYPEAERLFAGGDRLKWMDSDLFNEGTEVEIHMGYVDDLKLMLRGEITAVNCSFPAGGQPTLQVRGYSLYHRLQRKRIRRPFESVKDSDIAARIARDAGLDIEADDTGVEHPLVSPGGETCASFLLQRARRIGYEVAVKDRTLYFQRPAYFKGLGAALVLEWGKDLISFSPSLNTYNLPTQVTVRGMQTAQGRGKEPLVGTASAGDEEVAMGDETGTQVARAFGENNLLVEDHSITSAEEAGQMARARLEEASLGFITGRGSCVGRPDLMARTVIELKGLGRRFSGKYYVTSTTHTMGSRGYRTDFEVKRNAR